MNLHKLRICQLHQENREYPRHLVEVPKLKWPNLPPGMRIPDRVMRSSTFLCMFYSEPNGVTRLSIHRTMIDRKGQWLDGITWDELQRLKAEAGHAQSTAIEFYPPADHFINIANIRHLWVLPDGQTTLPAMWRRPN